MQRSGHRLFQDGTRPGCHRTYSGPMVRAAVRERVMACHSAYAHLLDDGHIEGWAECFTPDGRLETSRPLLVVGRENLIEFGRLWLLAQRGPTRHSTWHHELAQEGDLITGRCSAALLQTTEAGVSIVFTATYRDVFEFHDDDWRIQHRHVSMDAPVVRTHPDPPAKRNLHAVE